MDIWQFNAFFPQDPCGAFLLMIIAFHLVTLVHVLWPLDLVLTYQVSQACPAWAIWWWNAVLDYTISDDSLHNLTAHCLLKCQLLFQSFLNNPLIMSPIHHYWCAVCWASIFLFPGPFLDVILKKLEALMSNSLYVNLHLTGLISRLAVYPQPLLHSFMLNHSLVFQPSIRSLFQVSCLLLYTTIKSC